MPSRVKLLFAPTKKPIILLERISEWWLVSSIVVVAVGLRWWSPEMRSDLWYDEAYSIAVATQPLGQVMRLLLTADSSPPLYLLLLHFWLKIGNSDVHAKLLSLVFAPGSIVAVYRLVKLLRGSYVALIACLLFSFSSSVITYDVEVRQYSLFLFLSILSTYYFLAAILYNGGKQESGLPPLNTWSKYFLMTALVIYTHWFGLLLPVIHSFGILIYRQIPTRSIRQYLCALLAIGAACSPLVPLLLSQVRLQESLGGFSWAEKPNPHSILNVVSFLAGGKNPAAFTAIILLATLLSMRERERLYHPSMKHVYFFATYALLPIILVGLVSYSLDHYSFFVPRYFLPFSLGVVILLAFAISRMYTQMAILCVLLLVSYTFVKAWKHSARPEIPYSEIAAALPDEARPDLLIVHLSPMSYLSVRRYRQESKANEKVLWSESAGRGYELRCLIDGGLLGDDASIELNDALRKRADIWLVVDLIDRDPRLRELLEEIKNRSGISLETAKVYGQCHLDHLIVSDRPDVGNNEN